MAAGSAPPVRFPCWCKAVYSWGGETKRDLGFIEGDLIECLNAGDGSWWMGRLKRDRRMVGLFPSNFVELLSEDYQPWSRNASPMSGAGAISRQNSAQEQAKPAPHKSKSVFRKPFTAYAAASSPNPAAAARERLKATDGLASPNGSVKTRTPYASMKRSSTESRETPSPTTASRKPSNLRAVPPRPVSARPPVSRAVSPAPLSRHSSYIRGHSPAPPSAPPAHYQHHSRAVSPAPHAQQYNYSRAASPAPPRSHQDSYRAASPAPPRRYQEPYRAVSPAPPRNYQEPYRAVSPAPPRNYQEQYRAVSPAPPVHYQEQARAVSPAPSFQYQAYNRGPSPATSFQHHSRAPSPAPSFQYRAYDRGPSPSPYQQQLEGSRSPSPMPHHDQFANTLDSPPPPPPPHRVTYNHSRAPSPGPPPQHGYHTPEPPSPDPRGRGGHFTPSPLTTAMNDVMSSLQGMTTSTSEESLHEPATPSNPWSPEAFDLVYQESAKKARAQSALDQGSQAGYGEADDDDAPLNVNNYVQRMESRLRRMQQQERGGDDDSNMPPPPVPLKNTLYQGPGSTMDEVEPEMERKGSRLLRHRKSAYDVGRNALGRTFTSKTNSTNTTHASNSTNRSLMSGHSATNMSATSAGSYYRKKFGKDRPKSVMETSDTACKGYGFDDGRPETPFTGVTYHSSHASQPRPGSSYQQRQDGVHTPATTEGSDPLGGLMQPKAKRSGFFRKMIDTAKTQAANARSTIAASSISRPGSRAASRAASRATSRLDNNASTGIAGGTATPSTNATRDMGVGSVDWVQVRRDVNRSNSLSKNERAERLERCQMMDLPVLNPVDILDESAEGDEGLDGLPITEPTDFSACSLTHVDKSSRFINSIPLGTTPAALAQNYVCRPYRSDVQRLRAIFTWISERLSWEEDFEGEMDLRHVLQSKRGCSQEIAMVVAEMCASVGLHAEVVRGYLKTPGEPLDLDSVARPNHFWNAVIIEGEWRIMDCSLAGPTNPKRVHFSNAGSAVAEGWYFLARPIEICYSHVPLLPEQQHICPQQPHDVLMALPCATPTYFKHGLHLMNFDTSILNLDNLEMTHVHVDVPEDVECVAEVEARTYSQDMDGDFFESGEFTRKPALTQAEWYGGQKRYTVKALLPGDEGHGVLKIYAGPRGLMHSNKMNPHTLAIGLPLTHTGKNPPYSFLTLHPTPHAQRHDLYVAQPQCANLALNNTFVFCVRQHPSSLTKSPDPNAAINGRASPNPFARPASAMSMQSISASGSNYTQSSSGSSTNNGSKPAKLAIQTPSGKIIRLTRKSEHMGSGSDADGTTWETVIKIGERGVWRGLVLADRSARWCVFAQWECA